MQRQQMRGHQTDQDQRNRDHMEGKEAVQRRVTHHEVTTNQERQIWADERNRRKQVHDHLCAPVRHLPPRQQVAKEGFGHQAQENQTAKHPHQLAGLAVRTVEQATEHMQIHHHKESRSARGMHIANNPAARHIAHDVFDRLESLGRIRFVMHDEEDTCDNLYHQHQERQRAKDVPEVKVFRGEIARHMGVVRLKSRRETVFKPVFGLGDITGVGGDVLEFSHGRCP